MVESEFRNKVMLKPAVVYKEEIYENFQEFYFTDEMMFMNGCLDNYSIDIIDEPDAGRYQYAVIDRFDCLKGYIDFTIDWYSSCAHNFGIFSFCDDNWCMTVAIKKIADMLIKKYKLHRIEWKMVGGNPVEKAYDKFIKRYNGNKHVLKDCFKDRYGNYHDDVIYEIIFDESENEDKNELDFSQKHPRKKINLQITNMKKGKVVA